MVLTLDDTKRIAIGSKLADMKLIQELFIANEEMFVSALTDDSIRKRFQDMLDDDRKNMGVLETVIVQYGVKAEPKETVVKMVETIKQLMQGSELSLYEKASEHELLKHKQAMSGILIHKAAQVVGADIEAAITPLNTVNFENRAHQEQLKGILEVLGTRELTGQEPDQSLWGRVQDAVMALTGVAGSVVTRSDDEMKIQDLIRMDHSKADALFLEIQSSNDAAKIQEYFGQLYKDLLAHSEAEEQVYYPALRSYYNQTQDLYNEQAELKQLLDQIRALSPSSPEFKDRVKDAHKLVMHHKSQEENDTFPIIRDNFSAEQQKQLATQFKQAKSQSQDKFAASSR